MPDNSLRVRLSLRELEVAYAEGDTKPLEDLMRAWKGIKELPPTSLKSFFNLGGYHGEPFIQGGAIDNEWWGGYCNHGNVLFPTWHRVYVLKVEEALQSIVPDVMLPYWDETSQKSLEEGIPWSLTQDKFELDGQLIDNPLKSFVFPVAVRDDAEGDNNNYAKPISYETVRYPLSGLVGSVSAFRETMKHNSQYLNHEQNVELLNKNIKAWLTGSTAVEHVPGQEPTTVSIYGLFASCLKAPNYTAFSNTVSQGAYNHDNSEKKVVALESPHNDIHLAVGGYDFPALEAGLIEGSNGDMGENNTAAMDPIFFFHHCNVDRMFWLWQKENGHTDEFDIDATDRGANSSTSPGGQGPTPNFGENVKLTMDSPLLPFMLNEETDQRIYTSRDCINIETQLGFTYSAGSVPEEPTPLQESEGMEMSTKKLAVTGINRGQIAGSFVISAFATVNEKKVYLGHESVLSRWNVSDCANCQAHLELRAHFDLGSLTAEEVQNAEYSIKIQHRGKELPDGVDYTIEVID